MGELSGVLVHQTKSQDKFLEREGWARQVARGGGEDILKSCRDPGQVYKIYMEQKGC